jgi:CAF1 family ribonuclease
LRESGLIRVAVSPKEIESSAKLECLWKFTLAVSFLLNNKFRFDLPFSEGIPYLSRTEERQIRASWAVRDAERAAMEDMVLKADDKPLVDHIHSSVQYWLSQPPLNREDYVNIPHTTPERPRVKHLPAALNRYQTRLTHQVIRKDYTNLKTVGRDGFVRITIRDEEEDADEKLRQEQYRERDVVQAIEFRWIIEALCGGDISKIPERCFLAAMPSDIKANQDDAPYRRFIDEIQQKLKIRRRILFGHNCFTDLVYLYTCFIGDPPEKVEDFQELIHGLFPAVVDTKYLAMLVKELRFHSQLEALEKEMRTETVPIIDVPVEFDRYAWGERFHEAGFDSFMTAKIAIRLSAKLEREGKIHEPRKPQTIVKAGETILMDPTTDMEDEEQMDEYVTASESAAETDSVMSALATKLSAVFAAPSKPINNISQPFEGRKLPEIDPLAQPDHQSKTTEVKVAGQSLEEAKHEPTEKSNDQLTSATADAEFEKSANDTAIIAVKEKTLGRPSPPEVKQMKSALAHDNRFDILDTPPVHVIDQSMSGDSKNVIPSTGNTKEDTKTPEADLLIWSDREDEDEDGDHESDRAPEKGVPIPAEDEVTPMTASELEDKVNKMAKKGEMMPRWDSESGIWNVIGNRLVVNACEEGVCIL